MLQIATMFGAVTSGYTYKLYQIKAYDWLPEHMMSQAVKRLEAMQINKEAAFEVELRVDSKTHDELQEKDLQGSMDCVDMAAKKVYEFKCVSHLENAHVLQLALYIYIHEIGKLDPPR